MSVLLVSNILLWCVVLVLSVLVFALMRQIGVLHERVFPAGALMTTAGPKVGETAPLHAVTTWSGKTRQIGGNHERDILLLFVSPTCPVCKTLMPFVHSVARAESSAIEVLFASDGNSDKQKQAHEQMIREQGIDPDSYILSQTLGLAWVVEKLPFAALLDRHGILRAKGIVNSREHLESLFEAHTRGVASLQDYLTRKSVPTEKSHESV